MADVVVEFTPSLRVFTDRFGEIGWKKSPIAARRAINESLLFAQSVLRNELPQHFKIRSNWVSKGIRVTLARPQSLTGTIFSKDPFMALQEFGGDKPRQGPEQAVPFAIRGGDGAQKTLRSRWPGALVGKDRAFYVRTASRVGLVLKRTGRRKKDDVVLYALLGKAVHIKARWDFRKRVQQIVHQVFPMVYKATLSGFVADAARRRR